MRYVYIQNLVYRVSTTSRYVSLLLMAFTSEIFFTPEITTEADANVYVQCFNKRFQFVAMNYVFFNYFVKTNYSSIPSIASQISQVAQLNLTFSEPKLIHHQFRAIYSARVTLINPL